MHSEKKTDYEMEQLLPIVGKLVEKYTSRENTSVTYETAEQLMEAVLYCIHEAETAGPAAPSPQNQDRFPDPACGHAQPSAPRPFASQPPAAGALSAEQAYEAGAAAVREKVMTALRLYNEIIPEFFCYDSRCLYDTFVKGIPEFFKWYDIRFAPQDTIVTLDYPVLRNLSACSGIDKIYEYIQCIRLEQAFLTLFPEDQVIQILSESNEDYRDMAENLCEALLTHLAKSLLAGHDCWENDCCQKDDPRENDCCQEDDPRKNDCCRLRDTVTRTSLQDLRHLLRDRVAAFLRTHSGGSSISPLADYLSGAMDDIAARLKNAAENDTLRPPRSPFCAE
ncbi:MAG: hypothetical protein HDR26_04520 [Lachnospiraceae bacterium]|nr:hypothetical protein [Lachnospiraceae bacterium]